jgi:hypothetical protein
VETGLDLGDCSEWIRVERDSSLCELHNRAPQQRRRHPMWVTELQKEILCLCVSHFDLLPVLV